MVTLFVFCSNVGMKSSSPPSANESSDQQLRVYMDYLYD